MKLPTTPNNEDGTDWSDEQNLPQALKPSLELKWNHAKAAAPSYTMTFPQPSVVHWHIQVAAHQPLVTFAPNGDLIEIKGSPNLAAMEFWKAVSELGKAHFQAAVAAEVAKQQQSVLYDDYGYNKFPAHYYYQVPVQHNVIGVDWGAQEGKVTTSFTLPPIEP